MKNFALVSLIFILAATVSAQEKGSLIHFQKKGTNCLVLAGEKYDDSKFNMVISSDAYSGGTIRIKRIIQESFNAKKALLVFNESIYTRTDFYVKGKKDISSFEKWVNAKISKDPNGNSTLRVINGQTVSYSAIRKGNKLSISIQNID